MDKTTLSVADIENLLIIIRYHTYLLFKEKLGNERLEVAYALADKLELMLKRRWGL